MKISPHPSLQELQHLCSFQKVYFPFLFLGHLSKGEVQSWDSNIVWETVTLAGQGPEDMTESQLK